MLAIVGLVLLALLISIIGAAACESILEPGIEPSSRLRWRARGMMTAVGVLLLLLLWGGKRWGVSEAADYRSNRLYRPAKTHAIIRIEEGKPILRLQGPG